MIHQESKEYQYGSSLVAEKTRSCENTMFQGPTTSKQVRGQPSERISVKMQREESDVIAVITFR